MNNVASLLVAPAALLLLVWMTLAIHRRQLLSWLALGGAAGCALAASLLYALAGNVPGAVVAWSALTAFVLSGIRVALKERRAR